MQHAINWFEIPAVDFERAVKFYSTILSAEIRTENFAGMPNGFLPYDREGGIGGSIVKGDGYTPATSGSLVYLNAGTPDNIDTILGRVEAAGGKVLAPKMSIGDPGWIGIILDSEGNKVGLHAPN